MGEEVIEREARLARADRLAPRDPAVFRPLAEQIVSQTARIQRHRAAFVSMVSLTVGAGLVHHLGKAARRWSSPGALPSLTARQLTASVQERDVS